MTLNPNLVALQNAINTNTLTLAQQAALSNALAEIIPTFPAPDEISNSIPFDEEALARDWMAALYAVAIAGGSSGVIPVTTGIIIAPNAANLEATSTAGLLNGQPAIVETFGAEFSLQPIGALVPDGVTVLTSTDPTRVWERGASVVIETARAQATWFVDKQNVEGTSSDENDGKTGATALRTDAEVYRRWGNTWTPNLKGATAFTIFYLSESTDGSDPTFYAPNLEDGASFTQQASQSPAAFTGTLLAVTAKNHATNTALQSTFTPTTGAIAAGMVLVNSTRGNSRAIAVRNLGGGNWLLSQPMAAYAGGFPSFTEVDTWANGDAITGVVPKSIDIARIGAQAATLDASFDPAHLLQLITIVDANATAGRLLVDSQLACLENCPCERGIVMTSGATLLAENATLDTAFDIVTPGELAWGGGTMGKTGFGSIIKSDWFGSNIWQDTIVGGTISVEGDPGTVYIDTAATLDLNNRNQMTVPTQAIYGPGTLNVVGSLTCEGTATAMLPVATKKLNGVATGYSNATAAGVTTVHGGIALTSANLDAAAGAAGFGGYAYGGGATISLSGVQP
jgi:hypothetical protein